ncbi:hypothetical protein DesLBE_2337 [Desulfitobacterium sp. LBE]|uniref:Uncharacterized protein n=4 Tax=Desulfitobacterium hafniense TaxID=49338 RepID=A0A098B9L6_DESHA|nr:hypothetical protein Dhaf_1015 [Desulfitobacterium hafniense DCB-2]EHL06025.1 hypothetical protein HMPREF0322_03111 [Desulfitobacterium hafniense DP7]TWH58037.1 hypothetical protein DesLBE_2337 [Desulfitobacterium sp. LBE]CDX04561.1 Hypothetical protein DPCES_4675 [Desulfitobacterium hafniense]
MNWHEFCIDHKLSKNTVYEQQEGGIKREQILVHHFTILPELNTRLNRR